MTGLPDAWLQELQASGGWSVEIDNPGAEPIEVAGAPMGEVDDLVSTLEIRIQEAAQSAVDGSGQAASLVAIQPSTGGILAVAQNSAADQQGPVSLEGRFPPGSTFKVVTTAAALESGVVGPDEIVPCPAQITVSGRTIPNDDDFALGEVPLETAFARSCNTSQAVISDWLEPESMKYTAAQLGLGVGYFVPGLSTYTGSVPVTERGPGRVEAAIGQGEVLASPFGMAVMTASLANNGQMILPQLISGMPAANDSPEPRRRSGGHPPALHGADGSPAPRPPRTRPRLAGKTGTAEVGRGRHGWLWRRSATCGGAHRGRRLSVPGSRWPRAFQRRRPARAATRELTRAAAGLGAANHLALSCSAQRSRNMRQTADAATQHEGRGATCTTRLTRDEAGTAMHQVCRALRARRFCAPSASCPSSALRHAA